jgi:hypothetical protein
VAEKAARRIDALIVHCSDSPDERDIGRAEIEEWHRTRFAGVDIDGVRVHVGYHYIIRRDGTVEVGRPEKYVGAHVAGHNANSIGICWIGRSHIDPRQKEALLTLLYALMNKYALTEKKVYGHKEFNPGKTCPNLDMNSIRYDLQVRQTGGLT